MNLWVNKTIDLEDFNKSDKLLTNQLLYPELKEADKACEISIKLNTK